MGSFPFLGPLKGSKGPLASFLGNDSVEGVRRYSDDSGHAEEMADRM